jgi:hypothetical protein
MQPVFNRNGGGSKAQANAVRPRTQQSASQTSQFFQQNKVDISQKYYFNTDTLAEFITTSC